MKRHYFISDDLDDLEIIEAQLEDNGISTPQIHVLSESDGDVESHHLHDVNSLMKQDVLHSWEVGAVAVQLRYVALSGRGEPLRSGGHVAVEQLLLPRRGSGG